MCYVCVQACTCLPQLCSRFPWWIPGIRLSSSGLHSKHLHVLTYHAHPDCYKCNLFICNEILSIHYTKLNLRNSKARKLSRTFVTLWTVFSFQVMFLTVEWSRRGYSRHLRKIILDNRGKTTALPPRVCTVGVLVCCPCILRKCMCLAWHNSWALRELPVLPWPHFLRSAPKCGRAERRNGSGSTNGALWGRLGARAVCGRLHTAALSLWLGVSVWKGACCFYTPFRTARADSSADTLCH